MASPAQRRSAPSVDRGLRVLGRRLTLRAALGLVLVSTFVAVAISAPWLAPRAPDGQDITQRLAPPRYDGAGATGYVLGSDQLGRDVLSRIIYGARISLVVSALATLGAAAAGTVLGVFSGFYGGPADQVLMRIVDVQMAFPYLLLAIAFMLVVPPSIPDIAIVLAISGWVVYARIMRINALALREREFVAAARAIGARNRRILARHIVPNLVPTITVLATTQIAQFIVAEAALSFLGLGLPPGVPSWGNLMNEGRQYLDSAWWMEVFPGCAIIVATAGVGLLGDWLRDILDPHLRI
ncbi:MAG TPA: ABC transporter permease [bacterium]|nr:ABC transporter permease [bacterium]